MITNTTSNDNRTLSLMAEGCARMGYKPEPKMQLASLGGVQLLDRLGKVKVTKDFRSPLNTAWGKLLEQMTEKGIAIPDILRKPALARINDTIGISFDSKGLSVKAWAVEFDGTEDWMKYEKIHHCTINASKATGTFDQKSIVCIGYETVGSHRTVTNLSQDKTCTLRSDEPTFGFFDSAYADVATWQSHLADLKAAGTPLQVLYQLAEPIYIPFEEELSLSLPDAETSDLLNFMDIDGQLMYEVNVYTQWKHKTEADTYATETDYASMSAESKENYQHVLSTDIRPAEAWQTAHDGDLPVPFRSLLEAYSPNIDAQLIFNMLARLDALEK